MPPPKDPVKYEEWCKKRGEAVKKRYEDPEYRRKMSEAHKGLKPTAETIAKIVAKTTGRKMSEQSRKKMSDAWKTRSPFSEETRKKMSEASKGKKLTPETIAKIVAKNTGKKRSEEIRKKISESKKNLSEETRRKMSESAKLRAPPSEITRKKLSEAGKARKLSEDHRRNIGKALTGKIRSDEHHKNLSLSHKGNTAMLGKTHSAETRLKLCEATVGGFWYGNISYPPAYCEKWTAELRERVRAYFGYMCAECGTPETDRKLSIHHVHYNKKTCCDGSPRDLVPLCVSCHMRTNIDKEYWENHFTEMIYAYYNGKCFLTKEEMKKFTSIRK